MGISFYALMEISFYALMGISFYALMGISFYLFWEKGLQEQKVKKGCLFSEFG
jgi:tryptophan-rich sensory protein